MGKKAKRSRFGSCNVQYASRLGSPPTQKQPLANSLMTSEFFFSFHPWFRPLDLSKNQKENLGNFKRSTQIQEPQGNPWDSNPSKLIWISSWRRVADPRLFLGYFLSLSPWQWRSGLRAIRPDGSGRGGQEGLYYVVRTTRAILTRFFVNFRILVPVLVVGGGLGFFFH